MEQTSQLLQWDISCQNETSAILKGGNYRGHLRCLYPVVNYCLTLKKKLAKSKLQMEMIAISKRVLIAQVSNVYVSKFMYIYKLWF